MTKRIKFFIYLKCYDRDYFHFRLFANYDIKGYSLLRVDFMDEYFMRYQYDLISTLHNKLSDGSREL